MVNRKRKKKKRIPRLYKTTSTAIFVYHRGIAATGIKKKEKTKEE